ncbi:4-alpha-glucanotransferase/malto-oligosyltrehalose synthase,TIGR02401 [Pedobacter westerhofensis]|uniref:4-alpha-glucanotransferase n=1 Tax=Pedobacter westerhofensis TaxID=425512 RepID=A0A521C4F1_9SPHI|nr:malto-oligosyltrehalose synthase [Pedobacter westerhofensis]SMO54357.1 4-alpha-glucanotransferase/malto-oligosyltrehalose synthase,TIGR02401 [Pedobacter westerhofensis]
MLNPISTYRIQFHKDFTFKDFDGIIPYLKELGITTIYASPVLEASPGSMHGYDTVNPGQINPEIGTLEELRALSARLKSLNMAWIQDIVPNHMAFHPNNQWLMDVLEKGDQSDYDGFFDINWSGDSKLPLMVPFLGSTVEEAIAKQELKLIQRDSGIKLQYFETEWPVNDKVKDVNMPLQAAIDLQYYRPCSYKETDYKINYRRFFTVNSLICLNMQDEKVFTAYHRLIKTLLEEGVFQGLRVDHIDGLYDPETYFARLRRLAGEETYIVVEKILEEGEEVPADWPVEGTTGYDFLAQVNNLFTARKAKKKFSKFYESISGENKGVERLIRQKKAGILGDHMAGELDNLYQLFLELRLAEETQLNALKPGALKDAIGQLLICFPVYRFYGNQLPLDVKYHGMMADVLKEIEVVKSLGGAVEVLRHVLLTKPFEQADQDYNDRITLFYLRCMQFSGPLMAKGVEDTLMYTYNCFIGHNEVGDAPAAFGIRKKDFHQLMQNRLQMLPHTMNGTSTHDTKRGEDVRARLNVLTDQPELWIAKVKEWRKLNKEIAGGLDANDEYFIYQTLTGSYPMPGMEPDNYTERLQAYLEKALREGKVNSNWTDPDTDYEGLVKEFILGILDQSAPFWKSFAAFHRKIADFGILNSLSQLVLKFTCPGMPDTYQGTELWDLSLVDPDNRRPVDYQQRQEWLQELAAGGDLKALWEERYNGKIKLYLTHLLLEQLKPFADLLSSGEYLPLEVKGRFANEVFAFARKKDKQWLVVAVPLHPAQRMKELELDMDWGDTSITLPLRSSFHWKNLSDGTAGTGHTAEIAVATLFDAFPLGLLTLEEIDNPRGAGVLLHVTSLPSVHGIGDIGLEAYLFMDFLAQAEQKYWQLLPLNPIGADQAYSPYSSVSAMAGNDLLISLVGLFNEYFIDLRLLDKKKFEAADEVDFEKATAFKNKMLLKAYEGWGEIFGGNDEDFDNFCEKEKDWLDDFALYTVLKENQEGKPWVDWYPAYRDRDAGRLGQFAADYTDELKFVKWKQFKFAEQWADIRQYAAAAGIELYGDLPFYVSHDSADVWANQEFFGLDEEGKMMGIAGVPPDYFNDEGQLWGMPVYNWENMKADGYQWWIRRIRKNIELYDLLRLDHFRAFADYWEVPAGERTAVNGVWKTGPGSDFFQVLKKEFPEMPFVAEDLGEISQGVYDLRDEFGLPGMKVLQFAFGEDIGLTDHIPHNFKSDNFVVYTGTHDNNTTRGWYETDAAEVERKNLNKYTGARVGANDVHKVLSRLAYASVARIAVLPMQDILGLDGKSRMNIPASVKANWKWRLKELPGKDVAKKLSSWVRIYGRA